VTRRRRSGIIEIDVAGRIRNTRQLRAIQDALYGADRPMSIDEIHRAAQMQEGRLGVATVYRTLKALVGAGRVVAVSLPNAAPRFELSGKGHHHHFQCNECGRVFETTACPGDLRRLVPRRFQLTAHEIVLYGRCADCRG
jgi:Fur family transcriptional regulator, ferric uptake regulator